MSQELEQKPLDIFQQAQHAFELDEKKIKFTLSLTGTFSKFKSLFKSDDQGDHECEIFFQSTLPILLHPFAIYHEMAHIRDQIDVHIIRSREIMNKKKKKILIKSSFVGLSTLILGTTLVFRQKSISSSPFASLIAAASVVSTSALALCSTDYILERKIRQEFQNTIVEGEYRANALAADYLIFNKDGLSVFFFYCHMLVRVDNHKILKEANNVSSGHPCLISETKALGNHLLNNHKWLVKIKPTSVGYVITASHTITSCILHRLEFIVDLETPDHSIINIYSPGLRFKCTQPATHFL